MSDTQPHVNTRPDYPAIWAASVARRADIDRAHNERIREARQAYKDVKSLILALAYKKRERERKRNARGKTAATVRTRRDLSNMTPDERAEHKRMLARDRKRRFDAKKKSAPKADPYENHPNYGRFG